MPSGGRGGGGRGGGGRDPPDAPDEVEEHEGVVHGVDDPDEDAIGADAPAPLAPEVAGGGAVMYADVLCCSRRRPLEPAGMMPTSVRSGAMSAE